MAVYGLMAPSNLQLFHNCNDFPTVLYIGFNFHKKNLCSFSCELVGEGLNSCYFFNFPSSLANNLPHIMGWLSSASTATVFRDIILYMVA